MRGKGGKTDGRNSGVTIIRKEEVTEAEHHGGAWKVAYADFVTAMMAFFLVMWLLNATTEDQRKGLADYFSPNNLLSHASSGTGQPFGGHTVFDRGAMVSDRGAVQVIVGKRPMIKDPGDDDADTPLLAEEHGAAAPAGKIDAGAPGPAKTPPAAAGAASRSGAGAADSSPTAVGAVAVNAEAANPGGVNAGGVNPGGVNAEAAKLIDAALPAPVEASADTSAGSHAPTEAELRAAQEAREKQAFEQAAEELRQAVRGDPALAELSRQLAIDITPEGLRIQLMDEERLPMFATGSATPNERARLLLAKVAPVLMRLPEDIAVVGHTDAAPFAGTGKTNWELSTERANATRRLLTDAGLAEPRVSRVTGLADRDPLLPADPLAAANRRIAIIVLRGTKMPMEPQATPAAPLSAPSSVGTPVQPPATSAKPPETPAQPPATPSPARPVQLPTPPSAASAVPLAAPSSAPLPARSLAPPSAPPAVLPPAALPPAPLPAPPTPSFVPSFAPPSAPPSDASSAPPFAPPSAPPSDASSAPPSDEPSAPPSDESSTPPPAPPFAPPFTRSFAPSFVPSFVPSFTPPSQAAPEASPEMPPVMPPP